ncbi:MAG: extracellular solute-binding protein [Rhodocyclaceae bacterium]|jgi:putrescine transport system substrate-binding protein|nr:extracellular solute-binding protein [Rhodocyclaceae bacterium]
MLRRKLLVLGLMVGSTLAHAEDVLRVYGREGRLAPSVIEGFQTQTGIRVEYSTYSTAAELRQGYGYRVRADVVFPVHFQLPALLAGMSLHPLDPTKLPNLQQVDPDLLAMLAARDGQTRLAGRESLAIHAVPFQWGTVGLALNVPKVTAALGTLPEESWSLLFDPQNSARLAKCGIGLLDAPEETLSLLLNYKGHKLDQSGPRQIQRAGDELVALRGKAASFGNITYIEQLASGQLCMAMAWSGHALQAADAGAPLRFVMPREGGLMFIETMAIAGNAENVDAAHRFIDYLASAEVNIRNARETLFYPVIRDDAPEMARLAGERKELVAARSQRRSFYYMEPLGARQMSAVDEAWTKVAQVKR